MPEGSPGEPRIVRYCCVDITERRLNEQRQKLMMLELDHRVKNNLVAVLALAEQTLEQAGSMDEFAEKFAGRIQSLSRAHEALAKSKWTEVQVADMLDLVMSSYQGGDAGRIRCAGSPCSSDLRKAARRSG